MKIVIVLVVLGLIGTGVYFLFIADSAAYTTYKQFSTALTRGDREEALKYAVDEDVLSGQGEDKTKTIGNTPAEARTGIRFAHESETRNPDGTVTIQATLSVSFDPPGVTSAMGAMTSKFRQTANLQKTDDGWRVASFEDEYLETRNWKGEKQ